MESILRIYELVSKNDMINLSVIQNGPEIDMFLGFHNIALSNQTILF